MTDDTYSAKNTAVVLIDAQNEFLAEDGNLNGQIREALAKTDLKANLQKLLENARAAGVKIFYVHRGIRAGSFAGAPELLPETREATEKGFFAFGSYGAEIYAPLAPKAGDLVVSPHRQFNGFFRTDLEEKLREKGILKVVLAGLTSHGAVEGTGRHAMEAGFHVTFLKDAVADFDDSENEGTIKLSFPTFGHVVLGVDEFLWRVNSAAA